MPYLGELLLGNKPVPVLVEELEGGLGLGGAVRLAHHLHLQGLQGLGHHMDIQGIMPMAQGGGASLHMQIEQFL